MASATVRRAAGCGLTSKATRAAAIWSGCGSIWASAQPAVVRLVEDAVLTGALLGEQVEPVVEHLHVERGFVHCGQWDRERLVPDDLALTLRAREVVRPLGRRAGVPPLTRAGESAPPCLPVLGMRGQLPAKALVQGVDRLMEAGGRDLGADELAADADVRLGEECAGHGAVGVFGDVDACMHDGVIGVARQAANPRPDVLDGARINDARNDDLKIDILVDRHHSSPLFSSLPGRNARRPGPKVTALRAPGTSRRGSRIARHPATTRIPMALPDGTFAPPARAEDCGALDV